MNQRKIYEDRIKAERAPNLSRIAGLLVMAFFVYYLKIQIVYPIMVLYVFITLAWFFFIEYRYDLFVKFKGIWFFICTVDTLIVALFVYLSGMTYSAVQIGYVLITAQSSLDLIKIRGRFATYAPIFVHSIMVILTYLEIFPYMNITSSNNSGASITLLSSFISISLVTISSIAVNSIISTIYFQLNAKKDELESSLSTTRSLKEQQDLDYFLTAQLIEPLRFNQGNLSDFKVWIYEKQFKKFLHKSKNLEIGGDICLTENIFLGEEKYLFYINADAMGKSLQGASGVLVLISVIKSLILPYHQMNALDIDPKEWLKTRFSELNNIFLSFEGSMMVSLNIGMIHEKSKRMFYLNAEHPFSVLYRNGKANYIDNKNSIIRKLGTMSLQPKEIIFIHEFQFLPGDSIFIGSDGKDDLITGFNQKGEKLFNQDDDHFLKWIEKLGGSFEDLSLAFDQSEQLNDDVSILKMEFRPKKDLN